MLFVVAPTEALARAGGVSVIAEGARVQGCGACHSAPEWPGLAVEVPSHLAPGETAAARIVMTASSAVAAGFNLVPLLTGSERLTLTPGPNSRTINATELTHTTPKTLEQGRVSWDVSVVAPAKPGTHVLALYAVAANGNGMNTGDKLGYVEVSIVVGEPGNGDGPGAPAPAVGCSVGGGGPTGFVLLVAMLGAVAATRRSCTQRARPIMRCRRSLARD